MARPGLKNAWIGRYLVSMKSQLLVSKSIEICRVYKQILTNLQTYVIYNYSRAHENNFNYHMCLLLIIRMYPGVNSSALKNLVSLLPLRHGEVKLRSHSAGFRPRFTPVL